MTRTEAKDRVAEFEADVRRPGKFEGSLRFAPYFYEYRHDGQMSDGFVTPTGLCYEMFEIDPDDIALFPELKGDECVVLLEDDLGFVSASTCTKEEWEYFVEENTESLCEAEYRGE
jgi:hypothetical protein